MKSFGGNIAVQGSSPCIVFHIESSNWYLLRLYQAGKLIYQYIGAAETLEVKLKNMQYGAFGYEDGDVEYKITELKNFSEPDVSYEVYEDDDAAALDAHFTLTDKDVSTTEARYYKGDLHAHTNLSDGSLSPTELTRHAEALGLDFFFITDHNFFHHKWPNTEILVLPGIEFTGNTGHWNALNVKQPFDMYGDYDIENLELTESLMKQLKSEGTLVSINHPFLTIWSWLHDGLDMDLVDSIEIWNDPSYIDNPAATEDALKLWQASLKQGFRITAVGGTDFHHLIDVKDNNRENALNDPTTHVYSDGLNKQKLLDGIKAGRVFVTRFFDVSSIDVTMNGETILFGDHYDGQDECNVQFVVNGDVMEATVHLLTKDQHVTAKLEQNAAHFNISLDADDFVRFEIRQDDELIAFTNPIYHGTLPKTKQTFGSLKGMMK